MKILHKKWRRTDSTRTTWVAIVKTKSSFKMHNNEWSDWIQEIKLLHPTPTDHHQTWCLIKCQTNDMVPFRQGTLSTLATNRNTDSTVTESTISYVNRLHLSPEAISHGGRPLEPFHSPFFVSKNSRCDWTQLQSFFARREEWFATSVPNTVSSDIMRLVLLSATILNIL